MLRPFSSPVRTLALVVAVLVALATVLPGHALAQQPLTAPTYYLSALPELNEGSSVQGELTTSDGQSFKDGSRVDLVLFYPEPGKTVRLALHSDDFDTYLSVFDADGYLYGSNDDDFEGYGTDSVLTIDSMSGGRYLAVVSGVSAYDLGSYTLAWGSVTVPLSAPTSPLPVPGIVSGALDATSDVLLGEGFSGPAAWYAFTLRDPYLVDINMRSTSLDAALVLYDDQGHRIALNDDGGEFGSLDARITELLDAGDYVLGAGGYQPQAGGAYDLDVQLYLPVE